MHLFRHVSKTLVLCFLALGFMSVTVLADEKLWPKVKSSIPANQALEDNITAIMADMSLREKVGQLIMAEIKAISPKDAKRNNIGGLLNGGGS